MRRIFFLALIPVAAAVLTFGIRVAWDRWILCPVLDYPATIALGDRERGDVAIGRFRVTNKGRGGLLLEQFLTSCSCAGVEREVDGQFRRVGSVYVPAGEQLELAVRVAVGAPAGESQHVQVWFDSNDPSRPIGEIDVVVGRVKGGIFPLPSAVLFGQVRVGSPAKQVIDLYDNREPGRRIEKVRSLQPDRFQVRLLTLDDHQLAMAHATGGKLLARLEVSASTGRAMPLEGRIEVCLAKEGRRADFIPVTGEVVSEVECWPGVLVLPRRVGADYLYAGRVLVRHREGKPISIELGSLPSGLLAKVSGVPGRDDQRLLEVECAPALSAARPNIERSIVPVYVRAPGQETKIEFPMVLTVPSSSILNARHGGSRP